MCARAPGYLSVGERAPRWSAREGRVTIPSIMPWMPIDPTSFLISLVLGAIGFVMAFYGKRMGRLPHVLAGVTLMIFPYFAPNIAIMLVVGLVIFGGFGFALRAGL